ncbi:shikimate dehydrogenase [Nostoc sp. 3335mG]|nr:shikimate dehydrogenase [Nostoc sp. 3335mG]
MKTRAEGPSGPCAQGSGTLSTNIDRVREALALVEGKGGAFARARSALRIGLLGRGIGASLTPAMHEAEGRRLGLVYRYDLIDFDRLGLGDADLGAMLDAVRSAGYCGVNVTYPFKQAVIPLLDALSGEAEAIGAVNTVVFGPDGTVGHNTDCYGFAQSLRQGLGVVPVAHVVQFGAGGAGAAVAQALAELGALTLDIVDVDHNRAEALARQVASANGTLTRGMTPDTFVDLVDIASGIVNATPVGMEKVPGVPFDPGLLKPHQWVADIIYFPRETDLIRAARAAGCRVLPGGSMAVYQAVRAFKLFSGVEPDAMEMAKTFAVHA